MNNQDIQNLEKIEEFLDLGSMLRDTAIKTIAFAKSKTHFVFGRGAVKNYEEGGLDALVSYCKENSDYSFYTHNHVDDPMTLLEQYNGFDDYIALSPQTFKDLITALKC